MILQYIYMTLYKCIFLTKHICYTSLGKKTYGFQTTLHIFLEFLHKWIYEFVFGHILWSVEQKIMKKRCMHMCKSITVIFLSHMIVQLYTTEKLIFARKRKPKSTPQINQCSLECWEKTTHFCSKVYSVLQFMRVITFIWVLRHSYIAGSSLLLYWVI